MCPKVSPISIRLGKHSTMLWGKQPTAFFFGFNSTKFSILLVRFLLHIFYKKKVQLVDFVFNQAAPISKLFLVIYTVFYRKKRYHIPLGSFFSFFFFYFKKKERRMYAERKRFLDSRFFFKVYFSSFFTRQQHKERSSVSNYILYKKLFLRKDVLSNYKNKQRVFLPRVLISQWLPKNFSNLKQITLLKIYKHKIRSLINKKKKINLKNINRKAFSVAKNLFNIFNFLLMSYRFFLKNKKIIDLQFFIRRLRKNLINQLKRILKNKSLVKRASNVLLVKKNKGSIGYKTKSSHRLNKTKKVNKKAVRTFKVLSNKSPIAQTKVKFSNLFYNYRYFFYKSHLLSSSNKFSSCASKFNLLFLKKKLFNYVLFKCRFIVFKKFFKFKTLVATSNKKKKACFF